jgi:hypothetical protein
MIEAAIPDVAVATAINPIKRTLASNALYKNILPVPRGRQRKKTRPLLFITLSIIELKPNS